MRRSLGMLAVGGLLLAGCGSSSKTFANRTRPPVAINLTVYINNARVSVSPNAVGAGQVIFVVTNRATSAESLEVLPPGQGSAPLASTGPINPYATAQVSVNFPGAGDYTVSTGSAATTDAALASHNSPIRPATLRVRTTRASSGNTLLLP